MKKKILSAVLAFCMLFGSAAALPEGVFETSSTITASAEVSKATSGKCGENVSWSLKNGVLTISGKGAMYDYYWDSASASYLQPFVNIKDMVSSVIISSGVTYIGDNTFNGFMNLTSVSIADSVTSIGDYAFYRSENLKSISIPGSVNSIGGCAFVGTKWIENKQKKNPLVVVNGILVDGHYCTGDIVIPSSVKSISEQAFFGCTGITSVTIPNGIKSIGYNTFYDCTNLKKITIPSSVENFGAYAFYETKWLENQRKKNPLVVVNGILIDGISCKGSIVIPEGVTTIGNRAFQNTWDLKSVTIPDTVTAIDDYAFSICPNLKSITIPKSVISIGKEAFGYGFSPMKIDGFSIKCYKDSAGEKYAKDNGFKYTLLKISEPKSTRLAGANRYETASVISTKMYPKNSNTVIIATGLTFHDAMVAVPLASAYNAPLLLATEKHITAQTEAELKRLGAKNVIVVSTNGAIGAKAKAEFKAAKYNMTYIEGKTSFETAAKVAKALQTKTKTVPDTIFFATDSAFADALSASPVAAIKGAPIMYLKKTGSIDKATADYLKSVKGKVKNAYIIGGDGVISNAMMKNVANALGLTVNKTVVRVAGKNRYETCTAVNNKFKSVLTGDGICVAKGLDFPDALAGGVYAAATKQALFLADGKKLQDFQNTYLKGKNASKITVFGGIGAVPDELVKTIAQASV